MIYDYERRDHWGVYECTDSVHVIPCDEEGNLDPPHYCGFFCWCSPSVPAVRADGKFLVVHNTLH